MTAAKIAGLSSVEAAARLRQFGANELPHQGSRTLIRIAADILKEPMFALLLASGVVYLLLGDLGEALLLLGFASISVLIAIVQENRSERVLEALRDLSSPRALVIRDGARLRIAGREVVPGDLVIVAEGDRVAADGRLVEVDGLEIDESLLTGESLGVTKQMADDETGRVFAGSLIIRGQGIAEIDATGGATRMGAIGKALADIESATPKLRRETRRIVQVTAIFGLVACTAAVLLYGLLRGGWLDALLAGIALGMSMLPEEFPLVLTVFMVMGAWRMSAARVLTRRVSAIETLGAATVLCTDKTGTLTENRMTIVELRSGDEILHPGAAAPWSDAMQRLLSRGVLASAEQPFDPMEKAFHALHGAVGNGAAAAGLALKRSWPLRSDLLAVTQAWSDGDGHLVAVKGAPEAIIELCQLDDAAAELIRAQADAMATRGIRVLGVAEAEHDATLPDHPRDFAFRFLGLVGLADPLRASVPDAVQQCRDAGIRVVMITGDYPRTAQAIAKDAGIAADRVLSGAELAAMDDRQMAKAVAEVSVFARIMPEQKLRLVQLLQAKGEVVAMTGDGVNDAPALKAADIGIAMGGRGTDVAREAAAIVLLDDDFSSILRTVRLGRRIYDNLQKAMGYILAIHVPIAGMALLPLITGMPILFAPVHIAFLEMVIDPVCSIVFEAEPEEPDVMRRPPRAANARLLSARLVYWGIAQGLLGLLVVAAIYLFAVGDGRDEADIRALGFGSLVLVNLALVLVNRSLHGDLRRSFDRHNPALFLIFGGALSLLGLALTLPPARALFGFGGFHLADLGLGLAGAALVLGISLLARRLRP